MSLAEFHKGTEAVKSASFRLQRGNRKPARIPASFPARKTGVRLNLTRPKNPRRIFSRFPRRKTSASHQFADRSVVAEDNHLLAILNGLKPAVANLSQEGFHSCIAFDVAELAADNLAVLNRLAGKTSRSQMSGERADPGLTMTGSFRGHG
ncbi:hypothetical protein [Leisingera aquimarina]|uniref:hypothetical protein n=1 Tax=Leisingera aquimarina TaxID=476529 RepID=UPI0012EB57ED|nr:hypothetical protein [Leisingera aquimarina]